MHSTILGTRHLHWSDEAACEAFARALADRPELHDALIELHGPLGAGKTTFVRHLLRSLGVSGRIKSPTYAVMEPYEYPLRTAPQADELPEPNTRLKCWHFDFYRFSDPREWEDAGLREILGGPGLKLVEWPTQAGTLLPQADLRMELSLLDDHQRDVMIKAYTPKGLALLG